MKLKLINQPIYNGYRAFYIYDSMKRRPKENTYIRPTFIGLGTVLGGVVGNIYTPDNKSFIRACYAIGTILIAKGLYKLYKYHKKKVRHEEAIKMFEIFQDEASKLGVNNIDVRNAVIPKFYYDQDLNPLCQILFKDGNVIEETFMDNNYECNYIDKNNNLIIDITDAVNKAYSINKNRV